LASPELLAQIEFLERTGADHLRHTKFVGLREDKDPLRFVRLDAAREGPSAERADVWLMGGTSDLG